MEMTKNTSSKQAGGWQVNHRLITGLVMLYCLLQPLVVSALSLDGAFTQGGLLIGQTEPGAKVVFEKRELRVSAEGFFVLGFGRDAALRSTLTVTLPNKTPEQHEIVLKKRTYKEERINGLPNNKVQPNKKELDRIVAEQKFFNRARAYEDDRQDFLQSFIWPVKGPISGVYGSRRVLNGKPKRPHSGVDVAAPTGTPIVAPIDGLVTLVQQDLFYTGGTVFLHHGHGVSTMYIHLNEIFVEEGQEVKQGEKIAAVGMTGRATGPHLHWGMNWFNTRLDPALLVEPMPKPKPSPSK